MTHHILIVPGRARLEAADGANLLEVLRSAGYAPAAPCGGAGRCRKCRVTVNGGEALACQTAVGEDMTVEVPACSGEKILTAGQAAPVPVEPVKPGYLIAFDAGTTTLVCFLLSPSGEELAAESMSNPQAPYGADVISRIQQAMDGKMEELTGVLRRGMTELIEKCCGQAGVSPEEIGVISVVGNPCMQQLFLGIPPANLAAVPFVPVLTEAEIRRAEQYLPICPAADLLIVPDVSGYVGADTVAGVLATRMYESKATALMVDIGTNGEMVLIHRGKMTACSTAAGPALEGANIRFGMRGARGAIDHAWLEDSRLRWSVIGGGDASGICGSGMIDIIAALLEQKLLNCRGRIQSTEERDGQRIIPLTSRLYLTQEDIRQVQMAKGAISAGIRLMCAHLGITAADIDEVILAGAFGSFLDPGSACAIGLLPQELSGKIVPAGNIAGAGAKLLALSKSQLAVSQTLARRIEFIELAGFPAFQRTFAKSMMFP